MLQFIPITDEDLERNPELYFRLVPFDLDYPCRRLEVEVGVEGALGDSAQDTQKASSLTARPRHPFRRRSWSESPKPPLPEEWLASG